MGFTPEAGSSGASLLVTYWKGLVVYVVSTTNPIDHLAAEVDRDDRELMLYLFGGTQILGWASKADVAGRVGYTEWIECESCHDWFEMTIQETRTQETCPPCLDSKSSRHSSRRRAQKLSNGSTENVESRVVFERDEWTCGLCCNEIDAGLVWPHPYSGSLDHKVPLSRGGTHAYKNVQAAHLRCNISKGNRRGFN
jgi:5-methylcytosine-specific restriction endonuclease McrA